MTTNLRIGPNAFSFKLKYSAIWPPSKNFPLHRCINDLQGIPWSCSSFHYAIIFRSCWRSPHDTECCYRWHGNRSWAGWGVSEVLRRVRGSGDHESADIRVLADSGEDHGLITGAVWIGTRGLIKVHLHLSTCVLYSNWSIQVLSSTRRQQQTVHVVNPKTGISSQDLWTDWKCSWWTTSKVQSTQDWVNQQNKLDDYGNHKYS